MATAKTCDEKDCDTPEEGSAKRQRNYDVWRKISQMNGEINHMTIRELRQNLFSHYLNGRGGRPVIEKRLKRFIKHKFLREANITDESMSCANQFDFLVVISFASTEATDLSLDYSFGEDFVEEIVEFTAVLVDVKDACIVSSFSELCYPKLNPILTTLFSKRTGELDIIKQSGKS